jgi:8-amino-7-oxononanoate synthase
MSRNRFQQRLLTSLNALQSANQRRTRQLTERPGPVSCRLFGRDFVSFATNDYLGLCHDPRVCLAFSQAAADQAGSGASALIAGRSVALCQLEETLAEWEGTESSLVFPSGFAANIGTIMSLAGSRDAIFCDRDNHASLIDGCRGSAAKFLVYDRTRLDQLRTSIARRRSEFDLVFIVTDTVFSMDGTLADLNSLCDLADEFDGLVIADEAHATGIFGQHGRGVCEAQGVEDRVSVRLGTLSKSIGSLGGFAAGSQALCDWLWNSARSQFFSTALPPAVCAAATRSLQILREEPERRHRLHARATLMRRLLRESGVALMKVGEAECAETLNPVESPIAGVLVGDDALAVQVSRQLQERGFLIPAIRPPTVPPKTARLRLSISSEHTETQIEEAAEAISQVLASVR